MKQYFLRAATYEDISSFVAMLNDFYDHWDFEAKLPIDDDSATKYFKEFIDLDYSIVAVAVNPDNGKIAGFIGLILVQNLWHAESLLYKSFWYAKPEFPGAGLELLKFAKAAAIENDAKQLHIGSMHPRVNKYLERQGFKAQETNYYMDF